MQREEMEGNTSIAQGCHMPDEIIPTATLTHTNDWLSKTVFGRPHCNFSRNQCRKLYQSKLACIEMLFLGCPEQRSALAAFHSAKRLFLVGLIQVSTVNRIKDLLRYLLATFILIYFKDFRLPQGLEIKSIQSVNECLNPYSRGLMYNPYVLSKWSPCTVTLSQSKGLSSKGVSPFLGS